MNQESAASKRASLGHVERHFPDRVFAYGFSLNKRRHLRRFLDRSKVRCVRSGRRVPAGSTLLLWGTHPVPKGAPPDIQVLRVEDGFLRSVGLGAELVSPVSWVMDQRGIYYDATRPSDLEHLLQTMDFPSSLLTRANRLRNRIVASGLTKYNVGQGSWTRPSAAARVILVPGQVESDASLRFAAPVLHTNMQLLRAVREANPGSYVLYKPHPDVVAGLRRRGVGEGAALHWCDEVVVDVPMSVMLEQVDEVHVLTSLAGFEALLREKTVVCYGQPFYCGWGLTRDQVAVPRRTRRLTLEQIVAGALICYPLYVSRLTGFHTIPEWALDDLLAWRDSGPRGPGLWQSLWRVALRLTVACK
jgi:capsular polysaccharide export protein